ncbi:hypothetical protein BLNAU_24453 [Blattamonas nauphoetae]|uniref:Uncharacterized protein n=1 Tax=Blattamonas nauphoetae TaxID=2049346 RepID=A0ABQ9WMD2_9EUKA|nr:hypothetical protein BLNAU_24453 [Blattamonas nauphoetae]
MLSTLLVTTAPFGDCHSMRELYRSVLLLNNQKNISKMDTDIANRCLSLEWLNIPTGFGQPTHLSYDSLNHTRISTLMPDFLPRQVNKTRSRIRLAGTPVPAEVSVFLEFVKRFVLWAVKRQ